MAWVVLTSARAAGPGLPAWLQAERASAWTDPAHQPRIEGDDVALPGGARVGPAGLVVRAGASEIGLGVAGIGRVGSAAHGADGALPVAVGGEVQIDRGAGVREWFRSLPSGLEHGVTLASRPQGAGPLVVHLRVRGATPAATSDTEVSLSDAEGRRLARYGHLAVIDADGVHCAARLDARDDEIRVVVDDRGARYPLMIDPLLFAVREDTLRLPSGGNADALGSSVALSGDGLRALLGAPLDDAAAGPNVGSAAVFRRDGAGWVLEATLTASDGAANDELGRVVALDADGDVALVGAPRDDHALGVDRGSVRVFRRTGTSWSAGPVIVLDAGTQFGRAVALSGDGLRAVISAVGQSAAHVFRWDGSAFVHESVLTASATGLGGSVALDATATYALLGAPQDPYMGMLNVGSAVAFRRTGTTWTEDGTLRPSDGLASDYFGSSVALSSDATRALVGASGDNTPTFDAGSVRVFYRSGSAWSEEATLIEEGPMTNAAFGAYVSLSADGSTATAGRLSGTSATVFARTGTSWSRELVVSGSYDTSPGPAAVALDASGRRLLLGLVSEPGGAAWRAGAANVYVLTPSEEDGSTCASGASCLSGNCWAGVCCDQPCYDGCSACTAALTGRPDGTCAPYSATVAPTIECRSRDSEDGDAGCDLAEYCTSASMACPDDAVATAGTTCRVAASACDAAEVCDGTSHDCPTDRPSVSGTTCRASAGACDAAEACNGTSFACPADLRAANGVVCRGVAGACDLEERCDGVSAACPSDAVRSAGSMCRPAVGPCDVAEACDGSTAACPAEAFAPSGTVCNALVSDVCDAPDVCSGAGASCPETFLSGVECRPAVGACDRPEVCSGDAPSCPADAVEPAGMVCRAASGACDLAESCDGASSSCPPEVFGCGDAGDGGDGDGDGGVGADAGPPAAATGCACRGSRGAAGHGLLLGTLSLLGLGFTRRRRLGAPGEVSR